MENLASFADNIDRIARISKETPVIIDTDFSNETDDAFALTYALLSPLQVRVLSIHAAPYVHELSPHIKRGLDRSIAGIQELLDIMDKKHIPVFRGADAFLTGRPSPVSNAAVQHMIDACRSHSQVIVAAIGALTNVATAILLEPSIKEAITVVWLGGHSLHWPDTKEFNLEQDPEAVQIVLNSGIPFIWVPCMGVTSHMQTSLPEIASCVKGKGRLGDYLYHTYLRSSEDHFAYSRTLWDVAPIAYLIDEKWTPSVWLHAPILMNGKWCHDPRRHFIRAVRYADRNAIFKDLFTKIAAFA